MEVKYIYAIDSTDSLAHHGVKGQKWGVRRYQNPDGSLTEEGYQHWGLNPDGSKFRGKKQKGYVDATADAVTKSAVIGTGVGGAIGGVIGGPVGAMLGVYSGMALGAVTGVIGGGMKTRRMQRKIRKLLDEKGTVYVKDL